VRGLSGRTVGQYQILEEIGRGGMAVVYKAWQPSLERYVALKALPEYYRHDSKFLARFHREAIAAAGLSHSNIVHIYDTGEAAGLPYIAMEYLEGGSLQDHLAAGPLSLDEAQRILSQVANALDYAHGQGLIHRDIKPANILFVADPLKGPGIMAKVTDFGIARAADGTRLTRTGALMGTPEYMAPEQAEGGAVDHRADLYALGVVLYQVLTGQAPFRGTTPHAIMHAAIYEPPPPPRQLNPRLSPAVEAVILKALAKRPEDRFQRGADLAAALRAATAGKLPVGGRAPPTARAATAPQRSLWVWSAGALAILAVVAGMFLLAGGDRGGEMPVPTSTKVATPETPAASSSTATSAPSAAPSPISPTETLPPVTDTPLPPSDTPLPPTDSPIPPTDTSLPPTDTPVPPTEEPSARFGRLAFTSNRHGNPEIYVITLADGNPSRLTDNGANDWLPDWSPDGTRIAFTSNRREGNYDLWAMEANGVGQTSMVTTGAWDDYARWAPDGRRLALSSTAITGGVDNSEIFVRRADGSLAQRTSSTAEDQWPDWSPDGRLAYSEGIKWTSNWDIHVMNAEGSQRRVWLGGATCDVQPSWSPDGQWITFLRITHDTNGNGQVDQEDTGNVWVGRTGGGDLRRLTSDVWAQTPCWSPDGRWIAYAQLRDSNSNGRSDGEDAADIWAVPLGGGDAVPLVQGLHRDVDPSWTR
jgi:serine/threonine protein kinase/Tol biopolymer transport system component